MAQQKRKKKKRRSRHDPARREAARRREEARQQAAEERRRQQEAEERRTRLRKRLRRLTVPALATIGVFVLGFFLFRPPPELDEAIQITSPNALMSRLGYDNEWTDLQADDLPQPECGRAAAELSGIETYSAIYNGLITLWYRPTGRIGEAEIWDAVSEIDNHNLNVIVAPNSAIETPVAAASWNRLAEYEDTSRIADYVTTYLKHGSPGPDTCLGEYADAGSLLNSAGYDDDWTDVDPETIPEPVCGQIGTAVTGAQAHSALFNGAVILWHGSDDESTATKLAEIASGFDTQVLIAPNDAIDAPVVAAAWDRSMTFEKTDRVAVFVDAYQGRGPGEAACPTGFSAQNG